MISAAILLLAAVVATAAAGDPPTTLVGFDLSYMGSLPQRDQFEHQLLISALGGLVNRAGPTLFTPGLVGADTHWMAYLQRPGAWLHGVPVNYVGAGGAIEALVARFAHAQVQGYVLYDPAVPATSNVASTAAGAEDLLPVAFRPGDPASLYERLVVAQSPPGLPVALNLTGMFTGAVTGSAKNDAMRWAAARYLANRSSATNPGVLGYFVDYFAATSGNPLGTQAEVMNHDWVVARRGFFFDLSIWADEAPNDDPRQTLGTDRATFLTILSAAYERNGHDAVIHMPVNFLRNTCSD